MSLWLTDDELHALTGKRQRSRQIAVLAALRPPVRFRVRPDDSFPLVDRAQFETVDAPRLRKEPNYG
jgi:Domain of unknown function (DUF4224)